MALDLTILYRGPLSSCDYGCHYCPFAKRHETAAELGVDRRALQRFVQWVQSRGGDTISVFFTPWGEALIRRWYREAIVALSHQTHIRKVAVQTNLSRDVDWLAACDRQRVGLWCTYHPSQVDRSEFLAKCRQLDALGVRYSVGVVGLNEHFAEIEAIRGELAPDVYLWVNAYKDRPVYYQEDDLQRLERVDPLFRINNTKHASHGRSCRAGETVISVDGDGAMRRCHFIAQPIGNIYQPDFELALQPRRCTNHSCGCHIGYVHLRHLELYPVFGDGVLERIPAERLWQDAGSVPRPFGRTANANH